MSTTLLKREDKSSQYGGTFIPSSKTIDKHTSKATDKPTVKKKFRYFPFFWLWGGEEITMRDEYNFSDGVKNPYVKQPKATGTIRLGRATVDYFKELSEDVDMPYQTLINLYLADCASKKMKPEIAWR